MLDLGNSGAFFSSSRLAWLAESSFAFFSTSSTFGAVLFEPWDTEKKRSQHWTKKKQKKETRETKLTRRWTAAVLEINAGVGLASTVSVPRAPVGKEDFELKAYHSLEADVLHAT